jgi:hypothetical protein
MFIAQYDGKKVLINLAFADRLGSFGGKHRSQQLLEILERDRRPLPGLVVNNKFPRMATVLSGINFWLRYGRYKPLGLASFRTSGHFLNVYKGILHEHPDIQAVVIEGTGFGTPMITTYLKKRGIRVFFTPANIEALVSYDRIWTHRLDATARLHEEIRYFRQADGVFCISLTDQWLLSVLGVKAHYLPYWPPQPLWQNIAYRRSIRRPDAVQDFYVYLADFGNEPNYKGFIEMLTLYGPRFQSLNARIKLVGKGAERLLKLIEPHPAFEMEGFVTEERLEQLLSTCKGVVLHHYPSSGFLTRVVELWLSNIPIYSNLAASKDFAHMPGIHTFADFLEGRHQPTDEAVLQTVVEQYRSLKDASEDDFLKRLKDG